MSTPSIDFVYYFYLLFWILGPVFLYSIQLKYTGITGVLLYTYILCFFLMHWMGALVHASPWCEFADSTDTIIGFELSTYALIAMLFGALLVPKPKRSVDPTTSGSRNSSKTSRQVAKTLCISGIVFWLLVYTPAAEIPSATAVLSTGKQCLILGLCLFCRIAWHEGNFRKFLIWFLLSLFLPIVTVITQGFIGYGIAMLGTIAIFVSMFYRPRWHLFAGLLVAIYCGMSFWVVYADFRIEMREAVWGGKSYSVRFEVGEKIISALEFFDLSNQHHLETIDERLNQNILVGAAMRATPAFVPFENGATLVEALLAIIPRAIWPDKPVVGGSGNYAEKHTQTEFSAGTSVGLGQVLEFYINYGTPAVIIGFMLLGFLLRKFDVAFARSLQSGDLKRAQFYFLLGAGAAQPGGSASEIVASMGGGAVLALGISNYVDRQARRSRKSDRSDGKMWGLRGNR